MSTYDLSVVNAWKCGGTSVKVAAEKSNLLSGMFGEIIYTNFKKVKYSQWHRCLLIIGNPIESAVSAFNWRRHLVVETELQRDRFKGE